MVFHRFDSFLNRLNTMVEFFNTAVQVSYCQYCTALLGSVAYKSFHIPRRNEISPLLSFWSWKKSRLEAFGGKRWQATSTKCTRSSGWANTNTDTNINMAHWLGTPSGEFWMSSPYPLPQLWQRQLTEVGSVCKHMICIWGICLYVVLNPQRYDYDFAIWL